MILAVSRYADGEGPRPRELALHDACRYWGKLPRAGGILDQPYRLLDRLEMCANLYRAVQEYHQHWNEPEWVEEHPEIMRIMTNYWNAMEAEHGPDQS